MTNYQEKSKSLTQIRYITLKKKNKSDNFFIPVTKKKVIGFKKPIKSGKYAKSHDRSTISDKKNLINYRKIVNKMEKKCSKQEINAGKQQTF